jgi:hypothetical protein
LSGLGWGFGLAKAKADADASNKTSDATAVAATTWTKTCFKCFPPLFARNFTGWYFAVLWDECPNRHSGPYHLRALAFTVDDLALTALVRILPRSRYRLAGQTDSRFASFAGNTTRIAYRQQGPTPAFLLFSGPGQDPHAAALAAASWAETNWRPNAIQRRVRPGVLVVHVAPGNQLTPAGAVAGAAVAAAIWTVDSDTGRVQASGNPSGAPPAGEVKRAATALVNGHPPPSLGELDQAERNVMRVRTIGLPPIFTGAVSICLLLVALRFGLGGLASLFALPFALSSGNPGEIATAVVGVLILAGLLLGVGLLFNIRNLAFRAPGFSSTVPRTRNLAWGGFAAVMACLVAVQLAVLPAAYQGNPAGSSRGDFTHVTVTIDDDGSETFVVLNGDLTVDYIDPWINWTWLEGHVPL